MFDKVKQLNELRKKSKQMEKDLAGEVIEVVHKGVTIQVSANMQVVVLESNGNPDELIIEAINKAFKEVQKVAAKKMRGQLGDMGLNIPGL